MIEADAGTMLSALAAKPGRTKPVLRPDACTAMRSASRSTTDQPMRASSRAVVRPASPPPITHTSVSTSAASGGRDAVSTFVAAYQVAP